MFDHVKGTERHHRFVLLVLATSVLALFCLLQILRIATAETEPRNNIHPHQIRLYLARNDRFIREIAPLFEERYGLTIKAVVCGTPAAVRKVIAEIPKSEGTVDLLLLEQDAAGKLSGNTESLEIDLRCREAVEIVKSPDAAPGFIPLYISRVGFLYNKTVLPDPPSSWEDFNNFIDSNPGKFGFTAADGPTGFSLLYGVRHALLREESDPRLGTGNVPAGMDAVLKWFKEKESQIIRINSDYDAQRLFTSGKLQLVPALEAETMRSRREGRLPEETDMYIPDFGTFQFPTGLVIPKNSPRKEEAMKLVEFLLSEEIQRKMRESLLVVPVHPTLHPPEKAPLGQTMDSRAYLPHLDLSEKDRMIDLFRKGVLYD